MQCAFGARIDVGLSRSDQPRADSLEISRFLPSFFGKMAVFAKTESLGARTLTGDEVNAEGRAVRQACLFDTSKTRR